MEQSKVLVPLDGSEFSRSVLEPICNLFDRSRCRLTLLRVAPEPTSMSIRQPPIVTVASGYQLMSDYRSHAERDLAKHPVVSSQVRDSVRAELDDDLAGDAQRLKEAGFSVSVRIVFGDPAREIAEVAETGGFDVVVMATHGRGGLKRALMGSVAQSVAERASTNVMLLRTADQAAGLHDSAKGSTRYAGRAPAGR